MKDTFRKTYRPLRIKNQELILKVKYYAEQIENLIGAIDSREKSLAMTNLEQCVMWATKAIVLDDERDTE
ncbi:MAG TPA: hypothetical protein VNU45_18130 [Rummeliibacillus sp.]|nr:hypothetical protein [Rummeliibacillus sp.]